MDQNTSTPVNDSLAKVAYNHYSRHGSIRSRMMATYYFGQAEYDAGQNIPWASHASAYQNCTQGILIIISLLIMKDWQYLF